MKNLNSFKTANRTLLHMETAFMFFANVINCYADFSHLIEFIVRLEEEREKGAVDVMWKVFGPHDFYGRYGS